MSQCDKIIAVLSDELRHSNFELAEKCGNARAGSPSIFNLKGRIFDCRKRGEKEGFVIYGEKDKQDRTKWWYWMVKNKVPIVIPQGQLELPVERIA